MLKRILFIGSVTLLSALLLFGAVDRSLVRSVPIQTEEQKQVNGQLLRAEELPLVRTEAVQITPSDPQRQESSKAVDQANLESQAEKPASAGISKAETDEVVSLQGETLSVSEDELVLNTAGEELRIEGRVWRYAQEQGFTTQVGRTLQVTGFYDNQKYEVIQMTDLTSNQSVTVRDENGRPLWAGQGKGEGQNRGNRNQQL
jgi:hypothetical protein